MLRYMYVSVCFLLNSGALFVLFLTFKLELWLAHALHGKGNKPKATGTITSSTAASPRRPFDLEVLMLLKIPVAYAGLLSLPAITRSL